MTTTPAPSIAASPLTGSSTGPFPTGFKYNAAEDVRVWLELAGERQPDLTLTTDYTLTGATPLVDGGTVTLDAGVVPVGGWDEDAGDRIVIARRTVKRQALALPDTEGHKPRSTEAALDKLMRIGEEQADQIALTLRVPAGEGGLHIARIAERANKLFVFDLDGNPVWDRTLTQFDLDVAQVAADRVQTGQDRAATAADREAAAAAMIAAQAAALAATAARDLAAQYAQDIAVATGVPVVFASVASVSGEAVSAAVQAISTQGRATRGDGGGWPLAIEIPLVTADQPWHFLTNGGTRRWELAELKQVDSRMFPDGNINHAIAYSAYRGARVIVNVPSQTINYQVLNPDAVPTWCEGRVTSSFTGAARWRVGKDTANTIALSMFRSGIDVARSAPDFTGDDSPDVELVNVFSSFFVISTYRGTRGLRLLSNRGPCSYNQINHGRHQDHREAVHYWITEKTSDGADNTLGYINQNTHRGGRLSASYSHPGTTIAVLLENDSPAGHSMNGNLFDHVSSEVKNPHVTGDCVGIFGRTSTGVETVAANNDFYLRLEDVDKILGGVGVESNRILITGDDALNPTLGGDQIKAATPTDLLTLIRNSFVSVDDFPYGRDSVQRLCGLRRSHMQRENVGGVKTAKPSGGIIYSAAAAQTVQKNSSFIELQADHFVCKSTTLGPGRVLDVRGVTRDYLRKVGIKLKLAAAGGRLAAVCWDAAGVKQQDDWDCSLTWHAPSGLFRLGGDMTATSNEYTVSWGADVAFIAFFLVKGTADAKVKNMEIFAAQQADITVVTQTMVDVAGTPTELFSLLTAGAVTGYPMIDTDEPMTSVAPEVPAAGDCVSPGQRCMNYAPASAAPIGWVWPGSTAWLVAGTFP